MSLWGAYRESVQKCASSNDTQKPSSESWQCVSVYDCTAPNHFWSAAVLLLISDFSWSCCSVSNCTISFTMGPNLVQCYYSSVSLLRSTSSFTCVTANLTSSIACAFALEEILFCALLNNR